MSECKRGGLDSFLLARDIYEIYSKRLKELGKRYELPMVALDILMLVSRDSEVQTAADVIKRRGYKANLVSMHVETLVQRGCLKRVNDPQDRRRVLLVPDRAAEPIIEAGREFARHFHEQLLAGITQKQIDTYNRMIDIMRGNLEKMQAEGSSPVARQKHPGTHETQTTP